MAAIIIVIVNNIDDVQHTLRHPVRRIRPLGRSLAFAHSAISQHAERGIVPQVAVAAQVDFEVREEGSGDDPSQQGIYRVEVGPVDGLEGAATVGYVAVQAEGRGDVGGTRVVAGDVACGGIAGALLG